jgi:hypothetical protein
LATAVFTCGFLGGTLLWPVFLLPAGLRRPQWLSAPLAVLWVLLGIWALRHFRALEAVIAPVETASLFSVFMLGGLFVLASAVASCRARPDADTLLLGLWFFGTVVFTAFVNWTVNARVILPAVFPAVLLTLRWMEALPSREFWRRWTVAAACPVFAISMLVALSDARFAASGRDFAQTTVRRLIQSGSTVYFSGHWGFQYYMEAEGAQILDKLAIFRGNSPLRTDHVVVLPHPDYNSNVILDSEIDARIMLVRSETFRSTYKFATMSVAEGAGFYSAQWGPLPFSVRWNATKKRIENPVVNHFDVWRVVPLQAGPRDLGVEPPGAEPALGPEFGRPGG